LAEAPKEYDQGEDVEEQSGDTPSPRAPGTLPARTSGSKSTVVGEMVTSRAAKRPKMALIRRTA
jgi:hypothetical protein